MGNFGDPRRDVAPARNLFLRRSRSSCATSIRRMTRCAQQQRSSPPDEKWSYRPQQTLQSLLSRRLWRQLPPPHRRPKMGITLRVQSLALIGHCGIALAQTGPQTRTSQKVPKERQSDTPSRFQVRRDPSFNHIGHLAVGEVQSIGIAAARLEARPPKADATSSNLVRRAIKIKT
jgi:hypothetical protein